MAACMALAVFNNKGMSREKKEASKQSMLLLITPAAQIF